MWYWAEYSTFSISDEVGKYQLTVAGYRGTAGDAMMSASHPLYCANGMLFSTWDSDNDEYPGASCAGLNGSGWWHGYCSTNDVNRVGDAIWTPGSPVYDVQASRLLVKLD